MMKKSAYSVIILIVAIFTVANTQQCSPAVAINFNGEYMTTIEIDKEVVSLENALTLKNGDSPETIKGKISAIGPIPPIPQLTGDIKNEVITLSGMVEDQESGYAYDVQMQSTNFNTDENGNATLIDFQVTLNIYDANDNFVGAETYTMQAER